MAEGIRGRSGVHAGYLIVVVTRGLERVSGVRTSAEPIIVLSAPMKRTTCLGKFLKLMGRYACRISRRDSTRSINGLMPSSLEMGKDSSSSDTTLA